MNQTPDTSACEKIILADSLGVRLYYCPNGEVVELERGFLSTRPNPSSIQSIANIMMKVSLRLYALYQHSMSPRTSQSKLRDDANINETTQHVVTPRLLH